MKDIEKKIPQFENEEQEREFWAKANSTEYVNWKKAQKAILPNLKPSTKNIYLPRPESMIEKIKAPRKQKERFLSTPLQSLPLQRIQNKLHAS